MAWIERIVFGGPSRVIDVGVTQRLFTGATRRAVEVRDQECFHPCCDIAAPDCQVDHIVPYEANGPTTQDNGRLACAFHNRDRHKSQPP
jgi:5-methylcytosine-specific restriction endonuclease McrA